MGQRGERDHHGELGELECRISNTCFCLTVLNCWHKSLDSLYSELKQRQMQIVRWIEMVDQWLK